MPPLQYGCEEAEKTSVLAFCQRSDRILQSALGGTLETGVRRWAVLATLVILAAIVASLTGLSPR